MIYTPNPRRKRMNNELTIRKITRSFLFFVAGMYIISLGVANYRLNTNQEIKRLRREFKSVVEQGPSRVYIANDCGEDYTRLDFGGKLDEIVEKRNKIVDSLGAEPYIQFGWQAYQSYNGKETVNNYSGPCLVLTLNPFWE